MKIKNLIITMIFILLPMTLFANPEDELKNYLSNFHSMKAYFVQILTSQKGEGKRAYGHMALQRPGKFRWEITQPNRQIILADGKYLWVYDVDLEQATKQKLDTDANSPASLLSGSINSVLDRFRILKMKKDVKSIVFNLTPKSSQDMVKEVELKFSDGKLQQMKVIDNLEQKNIFKFSRVEINPKLPSSLFQFRPPSNVDIIQNR